MHSLDGTMSVEFRESVYKVCEPKGLRPLLSTIVGIRLA